MPMAPIRYDRRQAALMVDIAIRLFPELAPTNLPCARDANFQNVAEVLNLHKEGDAYIWTPQ